MSTLDKIDLSVGAAAVITVGVVVLMYLVYVQNIKLNRLLTIEESRMALVRRQRMSDSSQSTGTEIEVEDGDDEEDAEEVEAGNE